jgi:tripartite-type tricarboxylate transporter receptor subunit TctC
MSKLALGALVAVLTTPSLVNAQTKPDDFYKGKTIQLYIGYTPGGAYDIYARVLARYLGKRIPGQPDVIAVNMPGAGSVRLASWLYHAAPKDGTAIGAVGTGVAFDPLFAPGEKQYDATKFNWLASANNEVSICAAWQTSGISSFEDLKVREMTVGGTGPSTDTEHYPKMMNAVLGTKFRVVSGYPGGNEINLAMERGEVAGRCGWAWSSVAPTKPDWLKNGNIKILVQLALKKHADLPDVPLALDLAQTPEQKQLMRVVLARQSMGRPFLAPPGLPSERVALLRGAILETFRDPEFLAAAKKASLEVDPVSGEDVQQLVREAYETPPSLLAQARTILK